MISQQINNLKSADYTLVTLRVNGCYFWFNVIQILLTCSLLLVLMTSLVQFICFLQIWACFFIALDLMLRYFSEGHQTFFSIFNNKVDLAVLFIAFTSVWLEILFADKLHYQGDIFAVTVLSIRVFVQMVRLVNLFCASKKVMDVSKQNQIFMSIQNSDSEHSQYVGSAQAVLSPRLRV